MNKEIEIRQEKLNALLDEMYELSQPRSDFALKHFVVGQHDLPARQRQQVLLELQGMMFELANTQDEIKLAELDLQDLDKELAEATGTESERVKIRIGQKKRYLESMNLTLTGRLRECDTLYSLLQSMPKVSKEEFEKQEAEYWSRRLTRQFLVSSKDVGGNLNSIIDMMTHPGKEKPVLPTSIEQLAQFLGLPDQSIKLLENK